MSHKLKNNANISIFICGAGAQLTWQYAWASFLIFSFFQRVYPLPETVGIFCLGCLLTLIYRARRWRLIQVLGLHLAGAAMAGLWIVYIFYYRPQPWWGLDGLGDFFSTPKGRGDRLLLFFVLAYTIVFYISGVRFARQSKSYSFACARFDRGLMAFFGLFLLRLVIKFRLKIEFSESMSFMMIFPFFIFSLMEIGLARNQQADHRKRYLSGYHVIGLSASFITGAFIIGSGIFIFFLPYLNMASEAGYDLVKSAAGPLEPILILIVKFIFGRADWRQSVAGPSPATGTAEPVTSSPWMLYIQNVLTWGHGILMIVLGIGVAGLLIGYLVRWLFQKRELRVPVSDPRNILSWWYRLQAFVYICYQWIFHSRAKRTAMQYYTALQRWGRFSGFSYELAETPNEYGRRLSHQFPLLKAEFMLIIDMLQREVYGETSLDANQIKRIRHSWRKLHSPSRWPLRIKAIVTN